MYQRFSMYTVRIELSFAAVHTSGCPRLPRGDTCNNQSMLRVAVSYQITTRIKSDVIGSVDSLADVWL
jgi:hypothetical protein